MQGINHDVSKQTKQTQADDRAVIEGKYERWCKEVKRRVEKIHGDYFPIHNTTFAPGVLSVRDILLNVLTSHNKILTGVRDNGCQDMKREEEIIS